MKVIGLTGGIASGKSTVAAMLGKANIPIVDADEIAHFLTRPKTILTENIIQLFGNAIRRDDGSIDRQALARIIFDDANLRKKLEALLHPAIKQEALARLLQLKKDGHAIAVYMAPLIFETDLQKELDKTLLVVADHETAIKRAALRDMKSREHIKKRIDAQMHTEAKIALADEVILNNGTMEDLHNNLIAVWKKLTGQELN